MAFTRRRRMFVAFAYLTLCASAVTARVLLQEPRLCMQVLAVASALSYGGSAMGRSFLTRSSVIAAGTALVVPHAMFASGMPYAGDITCLWCNARFRTKEYREYCNDRCKREHQGQKMGKTKEQIENRIKRDSLKREEQKKKVLESDLEVKRKLFRSKSDEAIRKKREEKERLEREKREREKREQEKREQEKREREQKEREKKEKERVEKERKQKEKENERLAKELKKLSMEEEKKKKKMHEEEKKKMEEKAREKAREGRRSITGQSPIQEISCLKCMKKFPVIEYRDYCKACSK